MRGAPLIVVTSPLLPGQDPRSNIDLWRYVEALERYGAKPIVVAKGEPTKRALHDYDAQGILLSGGGDIDAACYGGRRESCTGVDLERDEGEIELFQEAYFNNIPILAICRGIQIATVALGGSLIEDIPSHVRQRSRVLHHCGGAGPKRFTNMHIVQCVIGSNLESIVRQSSLRVNSVHHQAVRELASQLVASAYSDDGIIEAIEPLGDHPGFFLGVQWHPEASPSGDASSRAIFERFVDACRGLHPPVTPSI